MIMGAVGTHEQSFEIEEHVAHSHTNDAESLAVDLILIADKLEWAFLAAGGKDFKQLYEAAKRIGEIADRAWVVAELD